MGCNYVPAGRHWLRIEIIEKSIDSAEVLMESLAWSVSLSHVCIFSYFLMMESTM
jgi:hypothetical protein